MPKPPPIPDFPRLTASVVRGPRADGRWYWRIRSRDELRGALWVGWATRPEALIECARRESADETTSPRQSSEVAPVENVGDLLGRWLDAQRAREAAGQIGALTLTQYEYHERHLRTALGSILLSRLARHHVEDVVTAWRSTSPTHVPVPVRTVAVLVRALAFAIRWGADRGLCRPLELEDMIADDGGDTSRVNNFRTPSREDVLALLGRLGWRGADLGIRVMAATGCRRGEALALLASDWDGDARILRVHGDDPRTRSKGKGRPRAVPVYDDDLADALDVAARRARAFVPDAHLLGNTTTRGGIMSAIERGCRLAKVEQITPHGLRRYAATRMALLGVPPVVACKILGHSLAYYLATYCRPTADDIRHHMGALSTSESNVVDLAGHNSGAQRAKATRNR